MQICIPEENGKHKSQGLLEKSSLVFFATEEEFTLTRFSTSPQTERAVRGEGGENGEGWEGKV